MYGHTQELLRFKKSLKYISVNPLMHNVPKWSGTL